MRISQAYSSKTNRTSIALTGVTHRELATILDVLDTWPACLRA